MATAETFLRLSGGEGVPHRFRGGAIDMHICTHGRYVGNRSLTDFRAGSRRGRSTRTALDFHLRRWEGLRGITCS